jgi:hypothetical protein
MTYVYVPPATSQNAQRLAGDLQRVIEEHQRDHPGLSKSDIDQALRLAGQATGARKTKELVVAGVMALLLGVGLLAFWLFQSR